VSLVSWERYYVAEDGLGGDLGGSSKVFFLTSQPLVNGDEDAGLDLYEAELEGGAVRRLIQVSQDPNAGQAAEVQGVVRVSENGERVYFVAKGELSAEEDPSLRPAYARARAGSYNLYVYEPDPLRPRRHRIAFVARLGAADAADWRLIDRRPVEATPDGGFLLFASTLALTPDDVSGGKQLFLYDAGTGRTVRVSVGQCPPPVSECAVGERYNEDGNAGGGEGDASFPMEQFNINAGAAPVTRSLSDDGRYVFFQSKLALTEDALEAHENVYEYHAGNVYLISDGVDETQQAEGRSSVGLMGTDASGQDVFFTTADPLAGQDTDTAMDVYDARVNGGFPAPVPPAACAGEEWLGGCLGALPGVPSPPAAGSAALPGGGNLLYNPPPKPGPLTRAQRRARALRACSRKKGRRRRAACRARVRRRYGPLGAHKRKRRRRRNRSRPAGRRGGR
jgi:hypothetical protein